MLTTLKIWHKSSWVFCSKFKNDHGFITHVTNTQVRGCDHRASSQHKCTLPDHRDLNYKTRNVSDRRSTAGACEAHLLRGRLGIKLQPQIKRLAIAELQQQSWDEALWVWSYALSSPAPTVGFNTTFLVAIEFKPNHQIFKTVSNNKICFSAIITNIQKAVFLPINFLSFIMWT